MVEVSSRRVLVTGATGFVGTVLCARLARHDYRVRRAGRRVPDASAPGEDWVACGDIGPATDWASAMGGCDAVVHLAGRAHILRERAADALAEFRRVNVAGSLRLAEAAAAAGVRRFVFASSIGVNGKVSSQPFVESDRPCPHDPYAVSKLEAEEALSALTRRTGMELVIVRPPLVYGPGCPGNLARLMNLLRRGIPLPLGAIDNRRSLIGVDNLADLLVACLEHPAAAGQLFLAADGEDVSTPRLLRGLADGLGVPSRLVAVPPGLLRLVARMVGRSGDLERLCSSLQVDTAKVRRLLDWAPPVPIDEGLRRTGAAARQGEGAI